MKQKLALMIALSLLASLSVAPAALAKDHDSNKTNQTEYWGSDCTKDDTERGSSWTADDSYRLVVLKSSGDNDEFLGVVRGDILWTGTGKDISHMILCGPGYYDDLDGDY